MKIPNIIFSAPISILLLTFFFITTAFSGQQTTSAYEYISPVPGSSMNMPGTSIIIRYGKELNPEDVLNKNILRVTGEKSGTHKGEIKLAENNYTILFIPQNPFDEGENVSVKLQMPVHTTDDQLIPGLNFSFRITEKNLNNLTRNNPAKYLFSTEQDIKSKTYYPEREKKSPYYTVMDDTLPPGFPPLVVDSINNPSPGYIFLTPFIIPLPEPTYLTITDNYGVPVFYRRMPYSDYDFKKQPAGVLTYYEGSRFKFFVLDSSYQLIDSLDMQNGYVADAHELLFLENNHSLLMCYDNQQVAMDTVVPGGNPNAIVTGLVIQELDENKNVVFQWRSWDHFQITDATFSFDLTDSLIDYVHGNAIEVDHDGNLLLSCRHMDEITKINRQTGDIIWRLGGRYCKNNQFTFINDPEGFSHQHDIRRLPDGNITLFDNGNLHVPPFSRAVEYQLDEENKLAFKVWEFKNNPETYTPAMGSVRRMSNHNTLIGWGWPSDPPSICEVTPEGTITQFFSLPPNLPNYRAFKFPWQTNLFTGNPDTLYFNYVHVGDSLELSLEIKNNSDQQIEINDTYNRDSVYKVIAALPVVIPPFGTAEISVIFKPIKAQDYFDVLHLRWDKETEYERIAQVIPLIGSANPDYTSVEQENQTISDYYLSQNYPNPFNPGTIISYLLPLSSMVTLKVYDILGKEVATLVNKYKRAGKYKVEFNGASLPSGVYFYILRTGSFVETKKMILLK